MHLWDCGREITNSIYGFIATYFYKNTELLESLNLFLNEFFAITSRAKIYSITFYSFVILF